MSPQETDDGTMKVFARSSKKLMAGLLVISAAFILSSCGRKGNLDPVVPGQTVQQEGQETQLEGAKPLSTVEGKSFILDPLI
ncbi:lipoprotein [Flexibacterium corallicola]|uniref:lipoprotein n=1 Tax=Flexibacterium corallicola TaxID=3037259 RepID=UPI00286F5D7B|nr:lipoprotein [Pseudovibrio sp. M1P-2-3]